MNMSSIQMENKWRIVSINKRKFRIAKSAEACNDVWFEILSRLPTKSLFISKCVCKAWRDFSSIILVQQRNMTFLSMYGLFFVVGRVASKHEVYNADNRKKYDSYLVFLSLRTKEIPLRIDSPRDNLVNYGYNEQLLGNLSLDLNPLYSNPSLIFDNKMYYTAHKGLFLTVLFDGSYRVVNPATKEVLRLRKPHFTKLFLAGPGGRRLSSHAIINLSCSLSTTACSFVVMRFFKPHKIVDVYYSKVKHWVHCEYIMEDDKQFRAGWFLTNYAFLRESQTLFFLTTEGKVVAFQFGSFRRPTVLATYSFCLPKVVRGDLIFTKLGESQGCMYLSHVNLDKDVGGMWIWKHCGVSSAANPWILLFEYSKTTRLCKPVAEEHISKFYDAGHEIIIVGFHPDVEVVFFYVMKSLFYAYDLVNDTFVEIAGLGETEKIQIGGFTHYYAPCLASLGPCRR